LILQKPKKSKIILVALTGIIFLGILLSFELLNSCEVEHISILSEIQTYEKTLDPEFCEKTIHKILDYNDKCEPYIEILDCG
jgi:hypothetical protein